MSKIKDVMIYRMNVVKELKGKIVELLVPMHPEAAELKAEEIVELCYQVYVGVSADDACFFCAELRNENGYCRCAVAG